MPSQPQRALMIRVRNVAQLAAKQGGKVGELLAQHAPNTLDSEVYSKMSKQFSAELQKQGVQADVQVVDTANMRFETSSPIWKYTSIGLLGLLGVGACWKTYKWARG